MIDEETPRRVQDDIVKGLEDTLRIAAAVVEVVEPVHSRATSRWRSLQVISVIERSLFPFIDGKSMGSYRIAENRLCGNME